jgi:hypothetical protein
MLSSTLGSRDPVDSIMLYVVVAMTCSRSSSVSPTRSVGRALDISSGEFLTDPDEAEGWRTFQAHGAPRF